MRFNTFNVFCLIITICITLTLWLLIASNNIDKHQYVNQYGSKLFHIPNIVHYVIFNKNQIDFITYLSILSVLKVQKPHSVFIHSNTFNFDGKYWEELHKIRTNTSISLLPYQQPTHIYGQLLSSVYHSSDVARIQILLKFGGIYLDTDVIVLKNLDPLRHFNTVVGWPENEYMGSQVLLVSTPNPFLKLWLEGYQKYHPRDWYYNAGVVPTEILQNNPYIAHYERESLGVQNLLSKLHSIEEWDWTKYYTIHLLSRHEPTPQDLNEETVAELQTNFAKIIKWILKL